MRKIIYVIYVGSGLTAPGYDYMAHFKKCKLIAMLKEFSVLKPEKQPFETDEIHYFLKHRVMNIRDSVQKTWITIYIPNSVRITWITVYS